MIGANDKQVIVPCTCGHSMIVFGLWHEFETPKGGFIPETVYISNYWLSFYAHQKSILNIVKSRLKMIWYILRGKEYQLYDITIDNEEDIQKFKKEMQEFLDGIGN